MHRSLAIAIVATLSLAAQAYAAPKPADTVLRNGYIYTVDAKDRVHSALAIRKGEIVYVGGDRGARRYIDRRTRTIDLRGRMAMPGLQDGHIHEITAPAPVCDLEYAPLTVPQLQARIAACLRDSELGTGPDDWLRGDNFYIQFMVPKGAGSKLTRAELDAASPQRPVGIRSSDSHTTIVNTRALQLSGITAATPDPPDGVIERDASGQPTGVLQDGARRLVAAPPPPEPDPLVAARDQLKLLNRHGITSIFVPGNTSVNDVDDILAGKQSTELQAYRRLQDRGELTVRSHFSIRAGGDVAARGDWIVREIARYRAKVERPRLLPRQVTAWRPGRSKAGPRLVARPGVSLDGAKLPLDGVIQYPAQTAATLQPYLIDGVPRTDAGARGQLYIDNPTLGRLVARLERAGMQSHVHAIGDRSVRVTLDAVQAARRANGRIDSRQSMAHAELVDPADIPRFARLDVIPVMSFQWAKPAPDSTDTVKDHLGPQRWAFYEPEGSLLRAGARIAFGSDFAVDPLNEFFALEVGVLREADWPAEFPEYLGKMNAQRGLPLKEAIRGLTINAAFQMHQDEVTGSLEKGKLADLIVLDRNLLRIPPDDISETKVLMTMVGGRIVYRR